MAAGSIVRKVVVAAAVAAAGMAQAQLARPAESAMYPGSRSSLGLQPGKLQMAIGCGASLLPCRDPSAARLAAASGGLRWNVEVSTLRLAPPLQAASSLPAARQGLNLSLVGSRPVFGSSFSLYGRLGTTYGMSESGGAAGASLAPDGGYGLSFGAGISYSLTPQLSATIGWDSHDLRQGSGGRDALRATSLGLQYRY
ncbi:MAG TPA: hypothetical protein VEA40_15490 [Ramlibacter sp.]|nr:hypothetical protein [Ramlibacter sp.]